MKKANPHIGSSPEDFLKEEGMLEEARAIAIKEAIAFQVHKTMEKERISKVEMARRMKTSRAALDRFLSPGNQETHPSLCRLWPKRPERLGDLRIELV